jgi:hypothetical protein
MSPKPPFLIHRGIFATLFLPVNVSPHSWKTKQPSPFARYPQKPKIEQPGKRRSKMDIKTTLKQKD